MLTSTSALTVAISKGEAADKTQPPLSHWLHVNLAKERAGDRHAVRAAGGGAGRSSLCGSRSSPQTRTPFISACVCPALASSRSPGSESSKSATQQQPTLAQHGSWNCSRRLEVIQGEPDAQGQCSSSARQRPAADASLPTPSAAAARPPTDVQERPCHTWRQQQNPTSRERRSRRRLRLRRRRAARRSGGRRKSGWSESRSVQRGLGWTK